MEHKEFFKNIKAGKIAPCYLFEGPEEHIKRSALSVLRAAVISGDMPEMNETRLTDPDANALIAAAETLPFMSPKRLVLILESGMLSGKAGRYDEKKSADALAEYLKNPPDTACIVFYTAGKADGRKKLYTVLKKSAEIVLFDMLDDTEMEKWIAQAFRQRGKRIRPETCARLIFTVGYDLTQLSGEVEKLSAYAGDREEITVEDIDAICIRTASYKVYDLASSLLAGENARAFTLCEDLLRDGEEPLRLLALLQNECRRLLFTKLMSESRLTPPDIAKQLGVQPFVVRQLLTQCRFYSAESLRRMSECCMDTEYAVKSGQMALEGALQHVMLQISSIRKEGNP